MGTLDSHGSHGICRVLFRIPGVEPRGGGGGGAWGTLRIGWPGRLGKLRVV